MFVSNHVLYVFNFVLCSGFTNHSRERVKLSHCVCVCVCSDSFLENHSLLQSELQHSNICLSATYSCQYENIISCYFHGILFYRHYLVY